jgi:sporulation-control protein
MRDYGVEEVEISFKPLRNGVEVALTVDRRGGIFTAGGERTARFKVTEGDLSRLDLARELRNAIAMLR